MKLWLFRKLIDILGLEVASKEVAIKWNKREDKLMEEKLGIRY